MVLSTAREFTSEKPADNGLMAVSAAAACCLPHVSCEGGVDDPYQQYDESISVICFLKEAAVGWFSFSSTN